MERGVVADYQDMDTLRTGSLHVDAERAFTKLARARRRAQLVRLLRRRPASDAALAVYQETRAHRAMPESMYDVHEIPIEEINGTVEPSRARLFDGAFRPAGSARCRWESVWQAEERGAVLPPISVVRVGDRYAVRDGHHRVSVARARGAVSIDAVLAA